MPQNDEKEAQVCQRHGQPDDLVVCPFVRCQLGRVPRWDGYGLPAGVRTCTVCDGAGRILRSEADKAPIYGPNRHNPPCICARLGEATRGSR